jgi:transcription elongation factor Elf1
MDRVVTGTLVIPFERHVSCNDPVGAINQALSDLGVSMAMRLEQWNRIVVEVRQKPDRLREWDCPVCGYRANYSTPSAQVSMCNGCGEEVNVAAIYALEDADRESTIAEFLAEVAAFCTRTPAAEHFAERLSNLSHAFEGAR